MAGFCAAPSETNTCLNQPSPPPPFHLLLQTLPFRRVVYSLVAVGAKSDGTHRGIGATLGKPLDVVDSPPLPHSLGLVGKVGLDCVSAFLFLFNTTTAGTVAMTITASAARMMARGVGPSVCSLVQPGPV